MGELKSHAKVTIDAYGKTETWELWGSGDNHHDPKVIDHAGSMGRDMLDILDRMAGINVSPPSKVLNEERVLELRKQMFE
jgi:hypothetical protein